MSLREEIGDSCHDHAVTAPAGAAVRMRSGSASTRGSQVGRIVPVVAASIAFVPFVTPTGPGNTSPVDVFIAAVLALGGAWAVSSRAKMRLPYVAGMSLYVIGGVVGALAGPVPWAGALTMIQDLVLVGWALIIANVVRGPQALRVVLRTWAVAGVVWAAAMIIGFHLGIDALSGTSPEFGGRTALRFADPNMAGTYFVTTIMLVWASGYPKGRLHRLGAYAVLLWALTLTGSNGSFAALGVALGVATVVRVAHRHGGMPALALGCVGAVLVGAVAITVDLGAIQDGAEDAGRAGELTLGRSDSSIAGRVELKELGWSLYGEGNLAGSGPGSAAWRLDHAQAPLNTELHDDYLATLVERGILGTAGLTLLIVSVTVRCRSTWRPPLPTHYAAVVPHPWALAGAISGLALSGLFYEVLHFRHLWALLALIAAIGLWRDGEPDGVRKR